MRFFLHGSLDPDVAEILRELGHHTTTPAQVNLPAAATPTQVIQICRVQQLELLTASRDLLDAILPTSGRREIFARVIVFLQGPPGEQAEGILRLFERYKRLTPGRLYTVTAKQVKVRQLPSGPASPGNASA